MYYTCLEIGYVLLSIPGPVVAIVLFCRMGINWTMPTLQTINYIGLAMESVNVIIMFEDDAIDESNEKTDKESTGANLVTTTLTVPNGAL